MSGNDKPFHNPFEALRGMVRSEPGGTRTDDAAVPQADAPASHGERLPVSAAPASPVPRAVVRLERSGRGGKEVTIVEHLAIDQAARGEWLKALKTALGCGGSVEGDRLLLQGDQRKRLRPLLEARGVKKVILG